MVEAASSVVSGQIYNVAAEHLKEKDVVIATAKATGVTGELKYKQPAPSDFFGQLMNVSLIVSSKKIQSQLGWQPRIGSLLQNADIWYKAYQAWRKPL